MYHYLSHPSSVQLVNLKLYLDSSENPFIDRIKFNRFKRLGFRSDFIDENLF